jgi:ribonuclease P protein component
MVVRFVPNTLGYDRFGIATGRRIGGAVTRNRIRRRIREVLRLRPGRKGAGWDILIVVRPSSAGATFSETQGALERLLGAVYDSGPMGARS